MRLAVSPRRLGALMTKEFIQSWVQEIVKGDASLSSSFLARREEMQFFFI